MADFKVSELLMMQHALCERHHWGPRRPEDGHKSLLWSIGEIGEITEILKKKGHAAVMDNPAVRAHFVEETADTVMYLLDMMECFGITGEEFSDAYEAKFTRNMNRSWAENRTLYEDALPASSENTKEDQTENKKENKL